MLLQKTEQWPTACSFLNPAVRSRLNSASTDLSRNSVTAFAFVTLVLQLSQAGKLLS